MFNVLAGFVFLVVTIAPLAPATPAASELGIPPVEWELVSFTGSNGVQVDIDDPTRYTVQFLPDGRMTAKLDCNQGSAGFHASDGVLAIDHMAATMALCDPESNEQSFQLILQSATKYAFDPDGLLLLSGDEGSLKLRTSLADVTWEWTEFAGGDGEITRPDDPSHYTVEFLPEGKLAIQADCSRATGTYTVDDPVIDLQIGAVTRAMCPPGSHKDRFLRDLGEASSFVFREGRLYLALPIDSGILEFEPIYVASAATPTPG